MNKRRYALRQARLMQPKSIERWTDGSVRVTRADGTVVIGRATNRIHDQVDVETGTPMQGPN